MQSCKPEQIYKNFVHFQSKNYNNAVKILQIFIRAYFESTFSIELAIIIFKIDHFYASSGPFEKCIMGFWTFLNPLQEMLDYLCKFFEKALQNKSKCLCFFKLWIISEIMESLKFSEAHFTDIYLKHPWRIKKFYLFFSVILSKTQQEQQIRKNLNF